MTIIFGESSSGKSTLALEMIKRVPKAIYFALDNDKSLQDKIDTIKNDISVRVLEDPFIIDLEMEILQNGGLKNDITHIVVDPINFIRHSNVYLGTEKVDNLKNVISSLEYIESTYNIKVIAIFTVLRNIDKLRRDIMEYGNSHSLIATKKKKIKKKKKSVSHVRG